MIRHTLALLLILCAICYGDDPHLARAKSAKESLFSRYNHPGIKPKRFLETAYYIETHRGEITHFNKPYLTKQETGIKHTIEYDSASGHIFIVLDEKKAYLGEGAKKKVYKAILYGQTPKLVARSEQSLKMDAELYAHKELLGAPGIMKTHAFATHVDKKNRYYTIYSELYEGTLFDVITKMKLSTWNKWIVMSDLLTGLQSIHSKNLVHRDLHSHNYLYHTERDAHGNTTIRAVIADLGRTIKSSDAKGLLAQMTTRMTAPEAFSHKKLEASDYFATDIYALGCIFHRLFHEKLPKWQKGDLRSPNLSAEKKKAILEKRLDEETTKRREHLIKKSKETALSAMERTELLILKMLDLDPKKRESASEHLQEMQKIIFGRI